MALTGCLIFAGKFEAHCNKIMIELLPLIENEDIQFVKDLIKEFVDETGSEVGARLLSNWPEAQKQFVKVFPYEYQRALREQKAKEVKNIKVL